MTREEAIHILKSLKPTNTNSLFDAYIIGKALTMAISALSEKKGEWIKIQSGDIDFPESIVCNKCHCENSHFDFNEHGEPIGKIFIKSNFCPNCGADMRGE